MILTRISFGHIPNISYTISDYFKICTVVNKLPHKDNFFRKITLLNVFDVPKPKSVTLLIVIVFGWIQVCLDYNISKPVGQGKCMWMILLNQD